jgi:hypothetical protein
MTTFQTACRAFQLQADKRLNETKAQNLSSEAQRGARATEV